MHDHSIVPAPPLVTVYIPCHNYGCYLAQAVESVVNQLYTHWELILIDEASSDDTFDVAQRVRHFAPEKISVLHNRLPLGLQRVANRVLSQAKGKYIIRLDADDWLDEGALLLMVAKLESDPSLGLVFGNYYYTDPSGKVIGVERRDRLDAGKNVAYFPPHGACTMVCTRALKSVGGYSEDVNAQDGWELWYKLSRRVGVARIDSPVFYYRQHAESLSRDEQRLLVARSKIFDRLGQGLEGSFRPSCMAVIGVRESYPGFSGVPYRDYEDKSLLTHALESAVGADLISDVVVSSESLSVLEYSESLELLGKVGKHRRLLRERAAALDFVPFREIMLHAGESYNDKFGTYPDIVVFLSIHAVRRQSFHINKALNVLRITGSDSVISVREEREPLFTHGEVGLKLLNPGRLQDLSYDRERLYAFNGAVIAVWWEVLLSGDLLGQKIGYVEMSAEDSLQIKTA